MKSIVSVLFLLCCFGVYVNSLAVMSVDLGSEWMKVGIVSPGVPMEIALNKESKRKTPAVISYRENVRLFGEDAQTVGVKFPKLAFSYLLDLLGKPLDHPLVKLYQQRFPYYELVENSNRGTVQFKVNDDTFYSPEELLAQLLTKAKEFAEIGAHQPIKECVLTVPGFFNQAERKAFLQVGELAGLKVLQLINDYSAVALNYGIFRSKTFNETAQYVIFYDMGASSTTATLVSYQTVKTKERGYVEKHPQATVLGVGFDRTLGGLEMQIRLRDYLAKKFNEMKKTKKNVFENPRAMAKLFKEAGRVKNVLSANAEHYAQVEGLLDEQDFRFAVKREDMENLCQDLFERVKVPIEQALKTAHLTMDVVGQVVLVGAGTRVPKVQEYLQKAVNRDLGKNLNTDEAAAMGAVYKAADLSTGFKVAKFITKDAVLYPIHVNFERATEDGIRQVKRTLFGLMNPYPSKKIITFNKYNSDFSFQVKYAELEYLLETERMNIGTANLSEYKLTGVTEALKKNAGDNTEPKGIKAHFAMDESGILNLINVELVVEKTISPAEEEEGTLSKLGSTFSKLFGGEEEKPVQEKASDEKPVEEKPEKEDKVVKNETTSKNVTDKEVPKETKPKVVTIKEPITAEEVVLTVDVLSKNELAQSVDKLEKLDKIDKEINRRATALNNLESYVIDVQTKLSEEEYLVAGTPEDIENIKHACTETSEWLYEDGYEANADTYEKKLDDLFKLTRDLFARVWEHKERPEALKALHSMLNHSSHFLNSMTNFTKTRNPDKDVFTDVEIDTLAKFIEETTAWRDKMVAEQDLLEKHQPVRLTVKLLMDKMAALDREVKYLVNKLKMWRPKKVDKPVEKADNNTLKNETVLEQEVAQEQEEVEPEKESTTNEEATVEEEIVPTQSDPQDDEHTEL